jgi:hypothetical protein
MKTSAPRIRTRKLEAKQFVLAGPGGLLLCFSACVFWTVFAYAFHAGSWGDTSAGLPAVVVDEPPGSGISVKVVRESQMSLVGSEELQAADHRLEYIWKDRIAINGRLTNIRDVGEFLERIASESGVSPVRVLLVVPDSASYGTALALLDRIAQNVISDGEPRLILSSQYLPSVSPNMCVQRDRYPRERGHRPLNSSRYDNRYRS